MTRLEKKIEVFLAERRESEGGGWAQITTKDVGQLQSIIQDLIDAKCEKDADSDVPIEFTIINRRETKSLSYRPLPYQAFQQRHIGPTTQEEKVRVAEVVLDMAMYNQRIAQGELSTAYDMLRLERERLLDKK